MATKKQAEAAKAKKEAAEKAKADRAAAKAKAKAEKEAAKGAKTGATPNAPTGPKAKVEVRHLSELSKLDRENLETLLRKDPSALSEVELGTLQARVAYLSSDEREKYGV